MKRKISKFILTIVIGFSFLNVTSNSTVFNESNSSQPSFEQNYNVTLPDLPTEN